VRQLKTLAEIAIEAGLVTKDNAVKAGRIAAQRQEPLVHVLIRELGVDEVALIAALRKQTRVPLIDPKDVEVDPEALRLVTRDVCQRLRILPLQVATEGRTKVLRIAMADPTDASAILELEHITHCEIEVTALPLSAIEELVDKGFRAFSTAVVQRPRGLSVVTRKTPLAVDIANLTESEVSVTAQIPLTSMAPDPGIEQKFAALCRLLVSKGVLTEAELIEALKKSDS
jgi:type II secretion system (T2SS) protein E